MLSACAAASFVLNLTPCTCAPQSNETIPTHRTSLMYQAELIIYAQIFACAMRVKEEDVRLVPKRHHKKLRGGTGILSTRGVIIYEPTAASERRRVIQRAAKRARLSNHAMNVASRMHEHAFLKWLMVHPSCHSVLQPFPSLSQD